MKDYEYLLIDVHALMTANAPLFQHLSTQFPSISYHDILLICSYLPTLEKDKEPTFAIYNNLLGAYSFDADRLIENESLNMLVEQLYLGFLTIIQDMEFEQLGREPYDPDKHTLVGEKFLSPNLMLVKIIDESEHHESRKRFVKFENSIRELSDRLRDSDPKPRNTKK